MIQRSLVEMHRRFGGISCPSLQGSYSDDGDSVFSRNIGKSLSDCMVSHQKNTVSIDWLDSVILDVSESVFFGGGDSLSNLDSTTVSSPLLRPFHVTYFSNLYSSCHLQTANTGFYCCRRTFHSSFYIYFNSEQTFPSTN